SPLAIFPEQSEGGPMTRISIFATALMFCAACSRTQMPENQIRDAQAAYIDGMDALASNDFGLALEQFEAALGIGGLSADQFGEAMLHSAECHIELGNFEDAAGVLDSLEAQATDLDQLYLARCKLYAKQGDMSKARVEFEAARKLNPEVQP